MKRLDYMVILSVFVTSIRFNIVGFGLISSQLLLLHLLNLNVIYNVIFLLAFILTA